MTLSHFLAVLRARWRLALAVLLGTLGLIVAASLLLPKKYRAEASVVVDIKPDPITGSLFGAMMSPAVVATQVDVITSDRVARKVIQNLKLDQDPAVQAQWREDTQGTGTVQDWLVELFHKGLDVKPSRDSNVITVTYKAPDPRFAALLANAFVEAYIQTALELRVEPARQYTRYFDTRSKDARQALEAAQAKLSAYQQANGIVASDERLDVETSRLNELASQVVVLQSLAGDTNSRRAQVAKGHGDALSDTLTNPVIASLKMDLSRAEANLQQLNANLGENHPQVRQARANIAELQSRLDAETRRVVSSVDVSASVNSARVAEARAQLEAQRSKVLTLKKAREELQVLQHDVEAAQRQLELISDRHTQSSLESQTQQSGVSVLSPATPPLDPSFPRWPLNIAIGLFLGGFLAVAAVLLRELADRRVRGAADLAAHLGLPVLGVLPGPVRRRRDRHQQLMGHRVIFGRLQGPAARG